MSAAWHFNGARPGDRARESQVEKFFNADDVASRANAIIREGVQNSLDAAPDDALVRVRVTLGIWKPDTEGARVAKYLTGFGEHFDAVRDRISNPPGAGEAMRFLCFEDFGTSGLLGDPSQWWLDEHGQSNPFFNYFRAEGISDKEHSARGRHGVGKFVFARASRIRTIFGVTQRNDGRQLLMGTTVLRNHYVDDKPFLPDGFYGLAVTMQQGLLVVPIENTPDIETFKRDFAVSRNSETGLSVIVPWLEQDVTVEAITEAVIRGYFYPIMRNKLVVEVVSEDSRLSRIDASTIRSVCESIGDVFSSSMRPVLELAEASLAVSERILLSPPPLDAAPRWAEDRLPEEVRFAIHERLEAGEVVALRIPTHVRPKQSTVVPSQFDVFLRRDSVVGEGQVIFIREGIIISDVRPRRTSGIRALVVIDEGPLATFLGDAENPAHTQWQTELVREEYTWHRATLEYVIQSVPSILNELSREQTKPDPSLLIDLFSLPDDDDTGLQARQKKRRRKPGGEPEVPENIPPPRPKRFVIDKLHDGFVLRRGSPEAKRPSTITFRAAYGVRRGSPFARYNPADFRLGLGGVKCDFSGCEALEFEENWMRVKIDADDFEIRVTGFDVNRDLHVDAKADEGQPSYGSISESEEEDSGELSDAATL